MGFSHENWCFMGDWIILPQVDRTFKKNIKIIQDKIFLLLGRKLRAC